MGTVLTIRDITRSYGAHDVLRGVSFDLGENERAALVGRNGSGKTTIFRIVSGMESPDSGSVIRRRDLTTGFMEQIPPAAGTRCVNDVLRDAFSRLDAMGNELAVLEERMDTLSAAQQKRYSTMQHEFEARSGYSVTNRIDTVCSGLGLDDELRTRLFSHLSGGEKNIVMLARVILGDPDLLLLDEPTNHLDIPAVEWLEGFLSSYAGTVLLVSHDRYFLDRVVTEVIDLEFGRTDSYRGNYSDYHAEKQRRAAARMHEYRIQQRRIDTMKEQITRFRSWSIGGDHEVYARKAKSLEKLLEKQEPVECPKQQPDMNVSISETNRSGTDVLTFRDVSKSFEDTVILKTGSFHIRFGEKVALLGHNGAGKSTVIRMLLGDLRPDSGEITVGTGVRTGYLPQEIVFPRPDETVFDLFIREHPMAPEKAMNRLARMLFRGDEAEKRIADLSGGEKVRLKLLLLFEAEHNLLILDEPTNHLDITSREIIEDALRDFSGTILFVSHDRFFINRTAGRIIELADGAFYFYTGSYDDMLRQKTHRRTAQGVSTAVVDVGKDPAQQRDRRAYEEMKQQRKLRQQVSRTEEKIHTIEKQIAQCNNELAEAGDDYEAARRIHERRTALEEKHEAVFSILVSLSETAE